MNLKILFWWRIVSYREKQTFKPLQLNNTREKKNIFIYFFFIFQENVTSDKTWYIHKIALKGDFFSLSTLADQNNIKVKVMQKLHINEFSYLFVTDDVENLFLACNFLKLYCYIMLFKIKPFSPNLEKVNDPYCTKCLLSLLL